MYQAKYTSSSLAHLRWLFIAAATTIVAAHFASEKADTQAHPYKNFYHKLQFMCVCGECV